MTTDDPVPPRLTALALLLEVAIHHRQNVAPKPIPMACEFYEEKIIQQALQLRAENMRLRQRARGQIQRCRALIDELREVRGLGGGRASQGLPYA